MASYQMVILFSILLSSDTVCCIGKEEASADTGLKQAVALCAVVSCCLFSIFALSVESSVTFKRAVAILLNM